MSEAASGSADKSIQVKLVLLGTSLFQFLHKTTGHLVVSLYSPTSTDSCCYPGEAAVGKSSVVLRFVCSFPTIPDISLPSTERHRSPTSSTPTKSLQLAPHSLLRNAASKTAYSVMRSGTQLVKNVSTHWP